MITFISRDYGVNVSIVRLTTTDTTATALAANYLTAQAANIAAANQAVTSNPFQWFTNDCVLLSASDGLTFCSINSTFSTLTAITSGAAQFAVRSATFTLTAAQFDAMSVTPVTVLAAAGAGTMIVPEQIYLALNYGGVQFAGGGVVGFQYGTTAALAGTLATNTEAAADFTGATSDTLYKFKSSSGNGTQVATAAGTNAAISISNQTAAFTAGTGSTFAGTIIYRVIPII